MTQEIHQRCNIGNEKSRQKYTSSFSMAALLTDHIEENKRVNYGNSSSIKRVWKEFLAQDHLSSIRRGDDIEKRNIRLFLEEADLWRRFHMLTNEMIVTKNGRLELLSFILKEIRIRKNHHLLLGYKHWLLET